MGSFIGNNRGTRLGILIVVALFVAAAAGWCSRAEAQTEYSGLSVGFGPVTIGSDVCDFIGMKIAQDVGRHWRAVIVTHGEGECRDELVDAQVGVSIARVADLGRRWEIGIGAGVFEHGDIAVGPRAVLCDTPPPRRTDVLQIAATIVLRRRVRQRLALDVDHFSTGGATRFNPGRNVFTLGGRF